MHYMLAPAALVQIRRTCEKIYEDGVVAFDVLMNYALIRATPGPGLHPLQVYWKMTLFTINTPLIDNGCGVGIS